MLLHVQHTLDIPLFIAPIEARNSLGFAKNIKLHVRQECRHKKRKPLDMVPVGMGKEQVQAPARFGQIGLHQIETQNANTGTGIDDDARALMLDKAAGGVAAAGT